MTKQQSLQFHFWESTVHFTLLIRKHKNDSEFGFLDPLLNLIAHTPGIHGLIQLNLTNHIFFHLKQDPWRGLYIQTLSPVQPSSSTDPFSLDYILSNPPQFYHQNPTPRPISPCLAIALFLPWLPHFKSLRINSLFCHMGRLRNLILYTNLLIRSFSRKR